MTLYIPLPLFLDVSFFYLTTQVFDNALDETTGKDVAKMLWLRSPSSEVWLERRTEYSRSLGLMSMVGYVRDFINLFS